MVRPNGRRGDDDLGPVMDRTGRVEGRTVTTLSTGVRGRHSTSDLPATPTHLAPGFNHGTACKPYIQQFPMLGYKNENKLLDICLRLDVMAADEFGYRQCISAHPIQPQEARRPPNSRMYVLRNTFVEALWLEAPSNLLTETWTSVPAIPSSSCTDDYMESWEYSQWLSPIGSSRYATPGSVGFDCT
ncbi:hypothetical protein M9H77_31566 [Catharanthus roseus]|uniref:Uncharacterized protein n=1 Tax=Catharanthus roseus TaxID=4058 RepID=A0ACC0A1B6_CATRO|nr:hypothetical protein M9H77_31566 [Catharanthus roseus]